jgi:UDP-N-acetylmuramate: L-alanyl-gamma-D-glutamyl-meso-diaminopimelate ligase
MPDSRKIHLTPIGGTAMTPLAALFVEEGHRVTGSAQDLYPPMSTLLESLQIPVAKGFAPEHVPVDADCVVVGNAALRDNVEAAEAARRGIPVLSMPQAIRRHLLSGKTSIVVTGTHGKTTTSALTAWLLLDSSRDPGFLIGGEMRNLGRGYRRGDGSAFVLEGDEYNAAFFDRGPKFLHYEPKHLFVGNIEYDHADLFPDLSAVVDAFRQVVAIVPAEGTVVANVDDELVRSILPAARTRIVRVSLADASADFSASEVEAHEDGTRFTLLESGRVGGRLSSPLVGTHNIRNALGAIALVRGVGVPVEEIARSLPAFEGVKRRLELKGEKNGILLVDDFAHHPTAVEGTIAAARTRWPGRRLWALFEPRSNTAGRKMFEHDYATAFSKADALVIGPVFHKNRLKPEERIDRSEILRRFTGNGWPASAPAGKPAYAPESLDEIPAILRRETRAGDVLLLMSSGAFGGLPETLLEQL